MYMYMYMCTYVCISIYINTYTCRRAMNSRKCSLQHFSSYACWLEIAVAGGGGWWGGGEEVRVGARVAGHNYAITGATPVGESGEDFKRDYATPHEAVTS